VQFCARNNNPWVIFYFGFSMLLKLLLATTLTLQAAIPAYALNGDENQFYYRYSKTGVITPGRDAQNPGQPGEPGNPNEPGQPGSLTVTAPATKIVGMATYSAASPAVNPSVSGNAHPVVWSAEGLPAGLTISPASGVITGSVTNGASQGDHSVKLTARDVADNSVGTASFKLTVEAPMSHPNNRGAQLKINVASTGASLILRDKANLAYRGHQLTWKMTSGTLPPGITTTPSLELLTFKGTPTQLGTYTSTWSVTDENGWTQSFEPITLSVVTRNPLTVSGVADKSIYGDADFPTASPVLAVTAPTALGTISWTAENLPTGLTINASTGFITGSVTDGSLEGTREIVVTATDAADASEQSASFYLTVNSPMTYIYDLASTVQQGMDTGIGVLNLRGPGNYPYRDKGTTVQLVGGTLPPGTSLSTSEEFVLLNGKPTALGTFNPTVKVTDQHGWTFSVPLAITVKVRDPIDLSAMANVSTPGNKTFTEGSPLARGTASNFAGDPNWTATGLPDGLIIDDVTGAITGSVTNGAMLGDHFVTVTVTDDGDQTQASTSFVLTVANAFTNLAYAPPALQVGTAMTVGGFALRDANSGVAYTGKGVAGTKIAGSLPAGISANVVGDTLRFSGTPTGTGSFTSTWALTDSSGWLLTLPSVTFAVAPQNPLLINAIPNTTAVGDTDYTSAPLVTITAKNATGAVKWSAQDLPTGLTINAATGAITGKITDASYQGSRLVTVTAKDDASTNAATFNLTVASPFYAAGFTTPAIKTFLDTSFAINLRATSGNAAYADHGITIALVSGAAVPGLTTSYSGGNFLFTGQATSSGVFTGTWKLTDSEGWSITVATTFNVTARAQMVVSLGALQANGMDTYTTSVPVGTATLTAGKIGTITWSATGLPTGLVINASTAKITGKITDAKWTGPQTVTVTAKDSNDGATGFRTVILTVRSPITSVAGAPAQATVGVAYSSGFPLRDLGNAGYKYATALTVLSGTIPPGLTAGVVGGNVSVTGTPTAAGTYPVVYRITDTATNVGWYTDVTQTYVVNP
jgi:hypothetical protein